MYVYLQFVLHWFPNRFPCRQRGGWDTPPGRWSSRHHYPLTWQWSSRLRPRARALSHLKPPYRGPGATVPPGEWKGANSYRQPAQPGAVWPSNHNTHIHSYPNAYYRVNILIILKYMLELRTRLFLFNTLFVDNFPKLHVDLHVPMCPVHVHVQNLMESYCFKHHYNPETKWLEPFFACDNVCRISNSAKIETLG